ncbi:hypothetical protein HanXRQr2_Chr09g0388891 [Helianthus annuus]|uniref:Uncharacterized protein n=1 Tax=Helianthus annuus TaxID=4232 RepID=A0A9K3N936_HELAN|nr:hypothetical protein HanXRQr2_Chr09g0388891 [Helianthus annuus]
MFHNLFFGNRFISQIRTSSAVHPNLVVLRQIRVQEGSACVCVRQEHRGSDPPIISPRRSGYPSKTRKVLGTRPKNRGIWASG